jgi:hypothetical protein
MEQMLKQQMPYVNQMKSLSILNRLEFGPVELDVKPNGRHQTYLE